MVIKEMPGGLFGGTGQAKLDRALYNFEAIQSATTIYIACSQVEAKTIMKKFGVVATCQPPHEDDWTAEFAMHFKSKAVYVLQGENTSDRRKALAAIKALHGLPNTRVQLHESLSALNRTVRRGFYR